MYGFSARCQMVFNLGTQKHYLPSTDFYETHKYSAALGYMQIFGTEFYPHCTARKYWKKVPNLCVFFYCTDFHEIQ
jgi:hypothetical protein